MQNKMIATSRKFAWVLAAVAPLLAVHPLNAQAAGADCSNLVVNKTYAGAFGGYLDAGQYFHQGSSAVVPNAGLAQMHFLRNGKLQGQVTLGIGLTTVLKDVQIDSTNSSYVLAWSAAEPRVCSGKATMAYAGLTGSFDLFVTQDGQRLEQIHTDAFLTVNQSSSRVEATGCGDNLLKGTYIYDVKGWALTGVGPLSGYAPFAFSGAMAFDGRGNAVYSDTVSLNGAIFPRLNQAGTYQVASNCQGLMTLSAPGSPDFHLELFVDKSGGTLYMVNIDQLPDSGIPPFIVVASMIPETSK